MKKTTKNILPKISITIPLLPGAKATTVLESLKRLTYPNEYFEIILIRGTHIARQRNKGLDIAKGDIIYLLDNDSSVRKDALWQIARAFTKKQLGALGGPSLTPKNERNYFSQLIGFILQTHFGALRMRYRYSKQKSTKRATEYQLIGANLSLSKKVVQSVGKFDEKIVPNEETELLRRIEKKGYMLQYKPSLYIYRKQRETLLDLLKQFFFYGTGRTKQIMKSPHVSDSIFSIPVFFLLYLLLLCFFHFPTFFIPLMLYMLLSFATATKAAIKYRRVDLFFVMPCIFPCIHIAYALGLVWQCMVNFLYQEHRNSPALSIEVVKRFGE